MTLVVADRREPARDVVELVLRDVRGDDLPVWRPGDHIEIEVPAGHIRQYSLCGRLGDREHWSIAILRKADGRGGSTSACDDLLPGTTVRARGPRNNFPLVEAEDYLFIAGGIGITPIRPMIEEVRGAARPWRLIYGGQTTSSMAFCDELQRIPGDRVTLWPQDRFGLLDLNTILREAGPHTAIYCCGPESLIDAVERARAAAGGARPHVERFAPQTSDAEISRTAFDVELARSGRTVCVHEDESILCALEKAGVSVASSCRDGTCGTCETAVLAGVPEHHDSLLTPEERAAGRLIFVCVSRSATNRLVLDL